VDIESSYSVLSEFGDDHLEHSDMNYIKTLTNSKELTTILHMYTPKVNKWQKELTNLRDIKTGARTYSHAFGDKPID